MTGLPRAAPGSSARAGGTAAAWWVLARLSFRETVGGKTFLLFLAGGALAAALPGARIGGRGPALWALGALSVAAGLAAGLAGPWVPGRLFRSPWFFTQPPGRRAGTLAGAAGQALATAALLLPALLLPLPAWCARAGEFHQRIPLLSRTFRPGPEGFLSRSGARADFLFAGNRPAAALEIRAEPVLGAARDFRPAVLLWSLQGGPWRVLGKVGIEARTFRVPFSPPRKPGRLSLARRAGPGLFLWFPPGGVRALGRPVSPALVWILCWIAAWNLSFLAAMALAWAGALLSRGAALLAGGGWALLALADPLFRVGFPAQAASRGLSPGWDLLGGTGWIPLGGALLFTLALARRPGRAWTRKEAAL